MKIVWKNLIVFLCLLICLIISMKVFYVQVVFVDEHNLGMSEIFGGKTMLYLVWLQLALLAVICPVSLIGLVRKRDT